MSYTSGSNITVTNAGTGGTASAFGAAIPPTGTAAGAQNPGGLMEPLNVDNNGNLLIAGSFSSSPVTSTTAGAAAQTIVGTSAIQVLAANASRKGLILQNNGTTVIKIVLGAGTPTQSVFHFALRQGGSATDGSSQIWQPALCMWQGAIQAISSGVGGILNITELT